jgi:hypothetical protein
MYLLTGTCLGCSFIPICFVIADEGADASSFEEFKHVNGHDVIAEETLSNDTLVEESDVTPLLNYITPLSNDAIPEKSCVPAEAPKENTRDVTKPSNDEVETPEPQETAVPEQAENIPQ